MKILFDNNYH